MGSSFLITDFSRFFDCTKITRVYHPSIKELGISVQSVYKPEFPGSGMVSLSRSYGSITPDPNFYLRNYLGLSSVLGFEIDDSNTETIYVEYIDIDFGFDANRANLHAATASVLGSISSGEPVISIEVVDNYALLREFFVGEKISDNVFQRLSSKLKDIAFKNSEIILERVDGFEGSNYELNFSLHANDIVSKFHGHHGNIYYLRDFGVSVPGSGFAPF